MSRRTVCFKRQVQSCQHSNTVTRLDFACVAYLAHGSVYFFNCSQKLLFAAFGCTQQIALAHDLDFELFQCHGSCRKLNRFVLAGSRLHSLWQPL